MGKLKDCSAVHQLKYLVKEWVWPESCAGSCILLTQLQMDTWATGTVSMQWDAATSLLSVTQGVELEASLLSYYNEARIFVSLHFHADTLVYFTLLHKQGPGTKLSTQLPHYSCCLANSSLPGFGFGTTLGSSLQGTWNLQGKLWTACATSLGFMPQDSPLVVV